MLKCKQNYFMKTRVGNEQTRCRVVCGEESFVLDFLFLFDQAKRKTHSFFIIQFVELI